MHLKTRVIVNPESNRGRTRKRWKEIKEHLKVFLKEYKYEFTEKPLQAIDLTRDAIKDGSELIVGVGGDGTMNEIANGFFEDRKLINPETTLGIVPSGTGCDLTRSLNIPPRWKDALKVITEAPTSPIDVGKVTYQNHAGQTEERYFLNVADFGVGGEVVKKVNQERLERKASSYVKCLVSTMIRYKSKRVRIRIDGFEIPEGEYLTAAVANGRIFGKGMKVAPHAKLDDGLFDIILVKGMKFLEFCRHGWKLFNGTHLSHPKISEWHGKIVEAVPCEAEDVLLELDGEQLGKLPSIFELVPGRFPIKGNL
jgi:diacylglycerol kinase (ATP)